MMTDDNKYPTPYPQQVPPHPASYPQQAPPHPASYPQQAPPHPTTYPQQAPPHPTTYSQQAPPHPAQYPMQAPMQAVVQPIKEKRVYSTAEKLLLLAALVIATLYDRLLFEPFFSNSVYPKLVGVFWLCSTGIFYSFFWKRLRRNRVSWYITGCIAALCMWGFFFWDISAHGHFGTINILVIPAVLMTFTQYVTGDYQLKDVSEIALAWLSGFFIKPFSGISRFLGATGSLLSGNNKSTAKKVLLGIGVTLVLFLILLPLLSSADRAFGYHLVQLLYGWDFASFCGHTIIVVIATVLFYSFLWNTGFSTKVKAAKKMLPRIDIVICGIVLSSITLLYVAFCAVQFTYLFAGAGLPGGMTYSEYAREGFAQTVIICAINFLIFGVFLNYGTRSKITISLLIGLMTLTGIMLFSGFVRLGLYIDVYGMTWLRLISAWFMLYMAAVVIICIVRIWKEKLPAVALCALILLGWYVVLGYANPDGLIARYNEMYSYDAVATAHWS
ncbi:MAG: DUF4173 domain-containing protein [Oscillospiraceae bacterium]|jgi:hypothetical protein|nr:DUF4173 domain-containing protein [Oscillospiraceae bacterium]